MYLCDLDAQPDHLTPRWLDRPAWNVSDAERLELAQDIMQSGESVFVPDPATRVRSLFTLGPATWRTVHALHTGRVPSDAAAVSRLVRAGIATSPGRRCRALDDWAGTVRVCRRSLEAGYAPVRGLIHPYQLSALRRYYRALVRRRQLKLGDGQCGSRYVAHNEPIARYFHHELAGAVAALLDKPVKPSYCYFVGYQAGAALEKHVDREQCEYTLALCLDFSPEPHRETPWPLKLELSSGTLSVYQALGDALLYRGRALAHWRPTLGGECTSTSLLFHYVDRDFHGRLS